MTPYHPFVSGLSQLCADAARLPLGPSDRHAALRSPDAATRLVRIAEALDDLIAVLRFQLLT